MYDIRQFKPALYALIFLGMSGFALAAEWPGIWVLSVGGLLLNAWLVKTQRFTPMPRILASIVTLIAFFYIIDLVIHSAATPILVIGQFLVLLQLVKLFEQRNNRDYGQLLVLSLLLMVAAAINTASLFFGLIFIGYLFLALYVCLLFHLKIDSEEVRKAIALPNVEHNPSTLRHDQRYLSSSMRRLTALISVVAVSMAVLVFLFFPRIGSPGMLGQFQLQPQHAMTGFGDQVGFQQVARITQNDDLVAHMKVWHNNKPVNGLQSIYLRGLTLNYYSGSSTEGHRRAGPFEWLRFGTNESKIEAIDQYDKKILSTSPGLDENSWTQKIELQPTGSSVLFAMAGASEIQLSRSSTINYAPWDGAIQMTDAPPRELDYTVWSDGRMPYIEPIFHGRHDFRGEWPLNHPRWDRLRSVIDPKIAEFALRPEVSGRDPHGVPLVQLRQKYLDTIETVETLIDAKPDRWYQPFTPFDAAIAQNIQNYLRTNFTYTLDLTDARRVEGQDPMVAFLYDFKRGHCEYFAGAMTLMLQSLGIPARVVIGFYCDDFNSMDGYYVIAQNQAHAWVEARGGSALDPVWITYDPTSGRMDDSPRALTIMTRIRHVMDYLEHAWAANVVAYDRGARENLMQHIENHLTTVAVSSSQHMSDLPDWLKAENWVISSWLLIVLIVLAVIALVLSIGWFVWERWRLRRRAARIGLVNLPNADQIHLAKQLKFYADLMALLRRRKIDRLAHQTPMEFAQSLTFLPADVYNAIHRLTEISYTVRFGRRDLTADEHGRLQAIVSDLDHRLGPAG